MLLLYLLRHLVHFEALHIYIPLCFYFIACTPISSPFCVVIFTFHYASTLSHKTNHPDTLHLNLHSTMLLLYLFSRRLIDARRKNLHSTMLLLYPSSPRTCRGEYHQFTFHYASTLSTIEKLGEFINKQFTFHYASTLSDTSIPSHRSV